MRIFRTISSVLGGCLSIFVSFSALAWNTPMEAWDDAHWEDVNERNEILLEDIYSAQDFFESNTCDFKVAIYAMVDRGDPSQESASVKELYVILKGFGSEKGSYSFRLRREPEELQVEPRQYGLTAFGTTRNVSTVEVVSPIDSLYVENEAGKAVELGSRVVIQMRPDQNIEEIRLEILERPQSRVTRLFSMDSGWTVRETISCKDQT